MTYNHEGGDQARIDAAASDPLAEVERRIEAMESCASPANECYRDHEGCALHGALSIVREVRAATTETPPDTGDSEREALDVLAELVALKDGPRDADYERRKPLAWDRARAVAAGYRRPATGDTLTDTERAAVDAALEDDRDAVLAVVADIVAARSATGEAPTMRPDGSPMLVARVQCPHRIGLCWYDPETEMLGLLPCPCNETSTVLDTYRVVQASPSRKASEMTVHTKEQMILVQHRYSDDRGSRAISGCTCSVDRGQSMTKWQHAQHVLDLLQALPGPREDGGLLGDGTLTVLATSPSETLTERLRASYDAKVADFAVETWVVSKAHEWATTKDYRFGGDLADVGVDRGRSIAKAELLAVLEGARLSAPTRRPPAGDTSRLTCPPGWCLACGTMHPPAVERILADRRTGEADAHTRKHFAGNGLPHCAECSEAAQDYVEWPCSRDRLVAAVRANESYHRSYETAGDAGEADLRARMTGLADEWDDRAALLGGDGACGDDSARVLAPVVKRHAAAIRAALATDPEGQS